jgi:uroporphyrinogen-III decarboxylase
MNQPTSDTVRRQERLLATLRRQPTDRFPVAPVFDERFLRCHYGADHDYVEAQLRACETYDFDPMVLLQMPGARGLSPHRHQFWSLHGWPGLSLPGWRITEQTLQEKEDHKLLRYTVETPAGEWHSLVEHDGYTDWTRAYPIKEEGDVAVLAHRPDPAMLGLARMLDDQLARIGERGLGYLYLPGIWQQASQLRGPVQLIYDVFDRPDWARRFLGTLREYLVACVHEMARSRVQVIMVNESQVGLGLSPKVFGDFVLDDDRAIVDAINEEGLVTVFHVCGRSKALLELMADTGADGIETLTPPSAGGDVQLADAKRRVGHRVCLRGGFDQHVLARGEKEEIASTVRACLDDALEGGGYILGPTGFLTHEVTPRALCAFFEAAMAHPAAQG